MENTVKSELVSKRTNWTPPMDRNFISLMVDQVHDGQYLDGQFRKHAWNEMLKFFRGKFGVGFTIDMLKNHYRAVKKAHAAIKTLLGEIGFGWDEEKEMVCVDDEQVWDDYIKAHPDFKVWRTKSMAGYDQVCIIFGDGGATGKFSCAFKDTELKSGKDNTKKMGNVTNKIPYFGSKALDDGAKETIDLDEDVEVPNLAKQSKSTIPQRDDKIKKPRKTTGEGMVDAIQGMASAITQMANKRESSSHVPVPFGASPTPSFTLEGKLVAALEGIPDIEKETYMQALDLLEDEKKAKIFVELPTEKRRDWLLYKLNTITDFGAK
ncbi:hypothetical protein ACHQM5_024651 [Ranunculus cassubicifolius]